MSNNGKELSAREKRVIKARIGSNTRVSQRAGSSTSAPEVGATAAPRSRRPNLEQNVVVATDNQLKALQKRHDETQKKTKVWKKAANVLEKFLSSFNQLARGYDLVARSQTRKLAAAEKARDDYMGQKEDLEKQVATLQEVVKITNDKRCKIDETFTKSESERKCLQQEVVNLKNRLGLPDGACNEPSRMRSVIWKIKLINGTLRVNIVLLAEVRGLLSATNEFAFHMGKLEDILKDLSAGGTESWVVDAKADAVPAPSSCSPSGDEDSSNYTTGDPP
ncbi:hypothetical protein AALP_AA5G191800 [Arabis alpina]|uniref:Uncharacterized protein n=1 Tax=Arabis alpina TaxID=50452 RepID=A0A087GY21_ARAAL|nr:hypothetical protein AALP_AA5G191800 [Arabis alpina]